MPHHDRRVRRYEFELTTAGAASDFHVLRLPFSSGYVVGRKYERTAGSTGGAVFRGYEETNTDPATNLANKLDMIWADDASDTDVFPSAAYAYVVQEVPFASQSTTYTDTTTYNSVDYESTASGMDDNAASDWHMTVGMTTGGAETYTVAIYLLGER